MVICEGRRRGSDLGWLQVSGLSDKVKNVAINTGDIGREGLEREKNIHIHFEHVGLEHDE